MSPSYTTATFHDRHEAITADIFSGKLELPHRYVFVLTNICNLSCDFCFQDRTRRSDAMTSDQWISLIDQLPDYARVTLTGGEPLAFKEFERVFLHATKKFECNMISNGLLLSEKKVDLLLSQKNFKVLSISIDDIGNINRDVKPFLWERFVEAIEYFNKRKEELGSSCELDIKTVVLDSNAADLLEIHKYCVEVLKANTHAFQFLKGSPLQHSDSMIDLEKVFEESKAETYKNESLIWEQLEEIRQYGLVNNIFNHRKCLSHVHPKVADLNSDDPIVPKLYLNRSQFKADDFKPCAFPWSSVHINVDGHLFPCLAVSMGNVKETALAEIINGEKFTEFRRIIGDSLVQGCNRCGWIRAKDNVI